MAARLQDEASRRLFGNIFPVEVSHFVSLKGTQGISPALNSGLFEELDDDHG